jgi:TonB-dependent SusC/RagA subfamily outer membrane receptor
MEILKDAASAAIYGAQAGNGVVLITTRRGKGDGQITYSYQLTAQSLAHVPHMMNSEQFISYYTDAGMIDMERIYRYWDFKTNTDWFDEFFETSLMQHHNLTFSWGNEKANLYVSASYLDNDGPVKSSVDSYERITGMVNGSVRIKPWIEIVTNNQIEHYRRRAVSEGSEYGSTMLSVMQLDPLTPVTYSPDELPDFMQSYLDEGYKVLTDDDGNYYATSAFNQSGSINPFVSRDASKSVTNGFNFNGSTAINFRPIKDFTFTSRVGYNLSNYDVYGYSRRYYANLQVHQNYVGLNGTDGNSYYYQIENFANYNHTFGQHTVNLMAGMSYSNSRS